jgi:trehalose synthase
MTPANGSTASPRRVSLRRKALEDYRELVGDEMVAEVREVTKMIHNGLQGMEVGLSDVQRAEYLDHNEANARALEGHWDAIVVHDPQPAAVRSFAPERADHWFWRCHIDSSSPHVPIWDFLRPYIELHELAAFTLESFVPPDLGVPTAMLVPAIDPITSKNQRLPDYLARQTAAALGVDLARPLLLQVSRFDPWKDPLGVVEVWRRVRETFPDLQLALVGSMATDDPEGWRIYEQIEAETAEEPSCLLLTDQMGVANHEVNAFQRVADVAIQKSIREGFGLVVFGLVVSETLWKGTAMVAGRAGGIPAQLEDGTAGYLAESAEDFASRVTELLQNPVRAEEMGAAGAERVRRRFLLPRLLRDHLAVLRGLVA